MLKHLLVILATISVVSGCGSPGPQKIRVSEADGEGQIVKGCTNLATSGKVPKYITESYLTTWGSAWKEGAAAGIREGLSDQGPVYERFRNALSGRVEVGDVLKDGVTPVPIYCRAFSATRGEVAAIIRTLLPQLGNNVSNINVDQGLFRTDLHDRSHFGPNSAIPNPLGLKGSRWKDRYTITAVETRPYRTEVKILREVFISRWDVMSKGWSEYHQGSSSGQNEGWILSEIDRALATR